MPEPVRVTIDPGPRAQSFTVTFEPRDRKNPCWTADALAQFLEYIHSHHRIIEPRQNASSGILQGTTIST